MTTDTYAPGGPQGDLKIDYEELPLTGKRTKDAGAKLLSLDSESVSTADAVSLYARDPLNTAKFPGLLRDIRDTLASEALQLERLGVRMIAIGEAADLADNADIATKVIGERGQIDEEATLTLFLIEQGETELAMEAALFDPGDEIKFIITADGRVRVWKIVDLGIEESASLSIKLLPDGSYGGERYQLSLSGQAELFGGVKGQANDASGAAQVGAGPKATIIFRSDDPADIAQNVEDVKTVVTGPLDAAVSGVKIVAPLLLGPVFGRRFSNQEAERFLEQQRRVGEAQRALARDYDAVEIGARYHGSAEAQASLAKPEPMTVFGQVIPRERGYTGDISIDGTVEVIYRYERHDSNGDKIIIRGTTTVAGSGGGFESASVGREGGPTAEVRGSATATGKATVIQQIEYDVDTERVKVTLTAEGQSGVTLAQSVGVSAKEDGPFGTIGHSTDANIGVRVKVVFEPQDGDVGEVLEAMSTGDYERALTAAGGTSVEVSEVRTASESGSIRGGVPNVAEGGVSATGKIIDIEPKWDWEPPEQTPPPAEEPPVPEIVIEDPPPQTIPEQPEPPAPEGKDAADKGATEMADSEMVNNYLTGRKPATAW